MNDPMNATLPLGGEPFDPLSFMNDVVEGVGSTTVTPIPGGGYIALIGSEEKDVQVAPFTNTKTQEQGLRLSVTFNLLDDDGSLKAKIDGRDPKYTESYFLELTVNPATGKQIIDMGKGKNVRLNRLREALGQNDGRPWSPTMLRGAGPCRIELTVVPDKQDPTIPRNQLKAVGRVNR